MSSNDSSINFMFVWFLVLGVVVYFQFVSVAAFFLIGGLIAYAVIKISLKGVKFLLSTILEEINMIRLHAVKSSHIVTKNLLGI